MEIVRYVNGKEATSEEISRLKIMTPEMKNAISEAQSRAQMHSVNDARVTRNDR